MTSFFSVLAIGTLSAVSMQAALTVPSAVWNSVQTVGAANPTTSFEVITSSVNNNGVGGSAGAYWNNATDDTIGLNAGGLCRNIGCFVTGVDNTAGSSPLWDADLPTGSGNPVYLAKDNTGAQQQDFYFSATPSAPSVLLEKIAGFSGSNWVGWYDQSLNILAGNPFTAANEGTAWGILFSGPSPQGTAVAFAPPFNFGIWMLPGFSAGGAGPVGTNGAAATALNGDGSRFSESSENTTGTGKNETAGAENKQYFTVFARNLAAATSDSTKFIIGIEDNFGGDNDYNDLVFSLSAINVIPEPGYYVLLSLGLLGLGLARSRMNKNADN